MSPELSLIPQKLGERPKPIDDETLYFVAMEEFALWLRVFYGDRLHAAVLEQSARRLPVGARRGAHGPKKYRKA